jgi:hypothetical protein
VNPFVEHHQQSIRFQYSCFDRMLLNAVVQPMQQPAMIVGFLDKCRQVPSITKTYFRGVSEDYHRFVARVAAKQHVQIVEPPKGVRREEWVEPFYQHFGSRFGIVVILKSRENARIAVSYPTASGGNRIEVYTRFVWQYYFYLRDQDWGRMFLRICPYFPFNAGVCVNQHEWLARQLQQDGIFFRKTANAFIQCRDPERLQQFADSLTPSDLEVPIQGWLRELVPFYASTNPNRISDCVYRLFCSQVEYCTNLIFKERAALDRAERLLDLNRSIGRPAMGPSVHCVRRRGTRRRGLLTREVAGGREGLAGCRGPRRSPPHLPRRQGDDLRRGRPRARRTSQSPEVCGIYGHGSDPVGRRATADCLDRACPRGRPA